jgi:hypothetical protein
MKCKKLRGYIEAQLFSYYMRMKGMRMKYLGILAIMIFSFSLGVLTHDCTEYTNIATERETSMETATMEGGSGAEAPTCYHSRISEWQEWQNILYDSIGWLDFRCYDRLIDAIEWVESGCDSSAVGDDGKAVGAFQIHKIYVDEVNRIIIKNKYRIPTFRYEDRLCNNMSRVMVYIYLSEFGKHSLPDKLEIAARIHNGGPQGYKKESTKAYWAKVKERLEK